MLAVLFDAPLSFEVFYLLFEIHDYLLQMKDFYAVDGFFNAIKFTRLILFWNSM